MKEDDKQLRQAIVRRAKKSFKFFFNTIYGIGYEQIEGDFRGGQHIDEWCDRLQTHSHTATKAPRKHSKTSTIIAFVLWQLFRADTFKAKAIDWVYISYSDALAGEKLAKAKKYIRANPYFQDIKDLSPQAETILRYKNKDRTFECIPAGIFTFSRGRHPWGVICDDLLKDPEKRLDVIQLEKIATLFFQVIMSLPKEGGYLHVVGTAQDKQDLFFQLQKKPKFDWKEYKAIISYRKKQVLWPEMFPFDRLIDIRDNEIGKKAFMKEYQGSPVRTEEGYFAETEIDGVINSKLKNLRINQKIDIAVECYAGLDIGKKRHPSHFAVFKKQGAKLVQVHSKWMDAWGYNRQVEYCKLATDNFNIVSLPYDNTRGEFEGFAEQDQLLKSMKPIVLIGKTRWSIAADFEKAVNGGRIELLPDDRQKNQILTVDNNLDAVESAEGHGDSFWSIALAIMGMMKSPDKKVYAGTGDVSPE